MNRAMRVDDETSSASERGRSAMTSVAREILEHAKRLAYEDRQALAEALWDTLEAEAGLLSPEQTAELGGRIGQLERGEVRAIPWSEAEARLRRTLGQDAGSFEVPEDFDEALSDASGP
jgi:putative addiction module component (TIGR02574 family)